MFKRLAPNGHDQRRGLWPWDQAKSPLAASAALGVRRVCQEPSASSFSCFTTRTLRGQAHPRLPDLRHPLW